MPHSVRTQELLIYLYTTHLNVSEKVAMNVLHPRERVVRQAEGMELGKMVVIRNVELKFRLI